MIGPKPDSVNMYMHIIGIKNAKDETTEFEKLVIKLQKYPLK
jgi:hypothetical protein